MGQGLSDAEAPYTPSRETVVFQASEHEGYER